MTSRRVIKGRFLTILGLACASAVTAGDARAQAIGFAPGIASAPDGAVLGVTPVASFDRRYVRMTINPQFYGLQGFNTVTVPGAVGGGGGGINAGFNTVNGTNFGTFNGAGNGAFGGGFGGPSGGMGPGFYPRPYLGELGGVPMSPPATFNGLGPLGGAIQRSTRRGWNAYGW